MAVDKVDVKQKSRKARQQAKRVQRRNQLNQQRKKKREAILNQKRKIGYDNCPPILVTVFNNSGRPIDEFLDYLEKCYKDLIIDRSQKGSIFVIVPRFKVRYQFLYPSDDLFYNLDTAKVADLLLILHPAEADEDYSLADNELLNSIYHHCLPTTMHIVCGLEEIVSKKRQQVKKNIQKVIDTKFPDEKLHKIDTPTEVLQLLQLICNCKKRKVALHNYRSSLLADKYEYNETDSSLKVNGFIRHNQLDVNGLIHIPGWSNYQIRSIRILDDPRPLTTNNRSKGTDQQMNTDKSVEVLKPDPMKQESLESENDLDPMEGEQTWPTPEELAEATDKAKKRVVKVPKGTSDYQAAWIIDPDEPDENNDSKSTFDDDSEDDYDEEGDDQIDKAISDEESNEDDQEQDEDQEFDTLTITEAGDADYDEKMDIEEEKSALTKFREARENELFPDEIDTPTDVPARHRFARYRGLKSFIHSPWDSKENLPSDYSRIFQFENFAHTRKRVIKKLREESSTAVQPGSYVEIILEKVPSDLIKFYDNKDSSSLSLPLVLIGLLPHEQKMSLINVVLRSVDHEENDEPIKSKDELIIHLGFRRFITRPIFSAHTNGDKFKFERFLPKDGSIVASFYAPITYPPASAVAYKKCKDGSHKLVAVGSLLNVNPDRIVIKRIRLSGHPFKVVRKSAVVRYMFFNREDIKWFQPVELRSKYGRHGHIKEPLGTHGHMKCIFDRPLTSNDTVLMNLYKRVYPKWCYREQVERPFTSSMDMDEMSS